jgi:hypothetical protein
MSIDFVHVVRNRYGIPFLNNGSGSLRQAPLRRYPQGWRVTNCTNASPIVCTTGTATHDIAIGNVVKVAKVLGNTAANGTFTVSAVTGTTFTPRLNREWRIYRRWGCLEGDAGSRNRLRLSGGSQ